MTIRDLVGERGIFRREQAVGLSASAYLAAKILVYSVAAAVQIAVVTAIVVIGKCAPTRGAVILGNPVLELYATLALTAAVAAIMGLALSAAATSQDQILPMLVISVMLSIVFCGGMIPVTARPILDRCPGPHRPAGVSPPERPQPTFRCSNPGRSAPKTRTVHTHPRGCSTWRCWSRTACSTPCLCAGRSG